MNSLSGYIEEDYILLNSCLRNHKITPIIYEQIDSIVNHQYSKEPLKTGTILYRGMNIEEIKVGDKIHHDNFCSTSTDDKLISAFGTIFRIKINHDDIRYCEGNPSEFEIILEPGVVLTIAKISNDIIDCEISDVKKRSYRVTRNYIDTYFPKIISEEEFYIVDKKYIYYQSAKESGKIFERRGKIFMTIRKEEELYIMEGFEEAALYLVLLEADHVYKVSEIEDLKEDTKDEFKEKLKDVTFFRSVLDMKCNDMLL